MISPQDICGGQVMTSEWQEYGNPQGYRAGVCRGRGRGMTFETP